MRVEEKAAIFQIIRAASTHDLTDVNVLYSVMSGLEKRDDFVLTAFGDRFIDRAKSIIDGKCEDDTCILCSKHKAGNKIVCPTCISQLKESAEAETQKKSLSRDTDGPDLQKVYARIHEEQQASDRYTEDLIRNLDESMNRLASRKAIRSSNRMLMAILIISLINTISIIAIAIIVLRQLNMI